MHPVSRMMASEVATDHRIDFDALAPSRRQVMRARLDRHWPAFVRYLTSLYGQTPQTQLLLRHFAAEIVAHANARLEDLWQLDCAREAQPNWHRGLVGYSAYVDRFGGRLSDIQQRIPHLQSLGISYLHLLPFLKAGNPPNDGGFAVASFDEVDPKYGTLADLKALTQDLRQAGISLCSDLVLNHVSVDHAWAKAALAGDPHYQEFFHLIRDRESVERIESHLGQIFPMTAPGNFTFQPTLKAWAWTTFYPYQWDLNYSNPWVFFEIATAMLRLANCGVEAFRLDSTAFLWKVPGTPCMNLPQSHTLLKALRCLCAILSPGVLLKAEAIMPTRDLPPYFGIGSAPGKECHLAYHSSLMAASWLALTEQKSQAVHAVLKHTPPLPEGCGWLTYVRCHDDIGWKVLSGDLSDDPAVNLQRLARASQFLAGQTPESFARGKAFQSDPSQGVHGTNGMLASLAGLESAQTDLQVTQATQRILLLQALSFFVGDLPLIYMGDEWGQLNAPVIDKDDPEYTDDRSIHRPYFNAHLDTLKHVPGTTAQRIFHALRLLIQSRNAIWRLLARGPVHLKSEPEDPILMLGRGAFVLGLFNFTSQPQTTVIPSPPEGHRWADALAADTPEGLAHLPALGYRWLVAEPEREAAA
jgi:amylosucrase